jgi:hypothetical protein
MAQERRNAREQARNRFLAACSLAGASTTTYRGPQRDGSATPTWIDVARLGSPDAPAVLVLCCGLHGVEGLCGSTIFTGWLARSLQRETPRDTGLVFVHTVLPGGMAIGGTAAPDTIVNRDWNDNILSNAARRFARYALSRGLGSGDDEDVAPKPDGSERLSEVFGVVAQEILEHAARACVLEFHTSLRPSGTVTVSSCHNVNTPADRRVIAWFGEEAGAGTNGPATLDSFALGFGNRLRDIELTAINADFGTYATKSVLRLDSRHGAAQRQAELSRLLFPDDAGWIAETRKAGYDIIQSALRGISHERRTVAAQRP